MNKLGKVAVAVAMAFSIGAVNAAEVAKYYEYVETDGTQSAGEYVVLNYTPKCDSVIEATVSLLDVSKSGTIFCSRGSTTSAGTFTLFSVANSGFRWDYNRTTATYSPTEQSTKYVLTAKNDGLYLLNESTGLLEKKIDVTPAQYEPANQMTLFGSYTATPGVTPKPADNFAKLRLYSFRAYDMEDGELVLKVNLRPCVDADGNAALYDAVGRTLYKATASKSGMKMIAGGKEIFYDRPDVLLVSGAPEDLGSVSPVYGVTDGLAAGESFICMAPACFTNAEGTVAYECLGYAVYTNGVEYVSGLSNSFTYTHPDCASGANLVWNWAPTHYKLDVGVVGGGTVDVEPQFAEPGSVFTVTATPNAGMKFWKWTGSSATAEIRYQSRVDVAMTEAKTLTANFYDPATTPRIIRYVTPDGTGDGTNWENACGDLATAYGQVVDNPSGGEVWLSKGRHVLDAALALVPNVSVRGAFAGNETQASQADPEKNPTILSLTAYKVSTGTWSDKSPMWTGDDMLTFTDPPDTSDTSMPFSSSNDGSAFENTDGTLIGNNEFTGLDFFRFGVHVFRLTTRGSSSVVIRNCRFLCCGWKAEGVDSPLYVDNVPVELTDCAFICCRNAARVCADTTVTSNVFRRCRFYVGGQNWNVRNAQPRAGCLAIGGMAWAHIDRCWFEKGQENDGGSSGASLGSGLVLATSVNALVEDSVFYRNVAPGGCYGAGVVANMTDSPIYTFNRCRFEKNRYSGRGIGAPHGGVGCAVGATGTGGLNFNNCAFVGNIVTNASFSNPIGSVIGGHGTFYGNFANCTFEDNVSFGSSDRYTFASSWQGSKYFAIANCVFCNNRNGYVSDDTYVRNPEFRQLAFNENQMHALVNTVLYNDDPDYIMFGTSWASWANYLAFASCVSSSEQVWGTPSSKNQFRYEPLDNATLAPLKDCTETNGVVIAHGIAEDSVYHKKGRPVYRAANGDLYIYDTVFNAAKPWRLLRNPGTVYTPEEGAEKGLSLGEPIADAFDKLRSKRKSDLGPIDFGAPGMLLLVK